jgi:hypothetical protein
MDVSRREQADPRVAMLGVVPTEEALAEGAGVLDTAEPLGEAGVVLEGLELALAVRVVIGDVRAAVGPCHAEVGQQHGDRLGSHRGAPDALLFVNGCGDALVSGLPG